MIILNSSSQTLNLNVGLYLESEVHIYLTNFVNLYKMIFKKYSVILLLAYSFSFCMCNCFN